ncbi:hypothetical protein KFE25_007216 [Diacronema lutheri]|uniref:ADP-ribosylation factor-like protein 2-binding protein n=1 Tax=Diacronema lutheri TaxID=2081491 RepID=A0A8J5XQ60_DIALT|nr:hypothetical protein KFE25_007216 [Diacronema lutheri]
MAVDMQEAVKFIDEVLTEQSFMSALKDFTGTHCEVFEASDENKLEYTPIFEQYAKLVEQYVDRRLVEKGVDLEQFMKDLPAYIDSPEAHPRTGAVLELLTSFDSFMAFKDMMLEAKKAKVAGGDEIADNANTFSADLSGASFLKENLEWTRLLEQGGAADGWSLIADKKWIQTHRKKDPESPINLTRCFATCNMPADKFMEIFMDPNIKTKWDEEVSSCEIIGGGGYDKDGYIVRQIIKIPLISQREMLWRWRWVRDHPEPGAHTAVVYSEPTDIPPLPNTYRVTAKIGNCVVRPMKDDPTKCRVTMFAQMDFGLPSFIANHTSSNWMVRNILKLESAYKSMYLAAGATK